MLNFTAKIEVQGHIKAVERTDLDFIEIVAEGIIALDFVEESHIGTNMDSS